MFLGPALCIAVKKVEKYSLNSQPRELILDEFSGKKKKKPQQFLAHREFVSSLKWMWFEWDPETL